MSEATVGVIRVLPFDFPGAPESVPYNKDTAPGYAGYCGVNIGNVPYDIRVKAGCPEPKVVSGFFCTRYPHPADEVHISHLRRPHSGEPISLVVWGGE